MQTQFTPAQLQDPDTAASERILRKCVHCGFCTATCPTYVLLGDELDSPRGRIVLIKDLLESGRPATAEVVRHVDRCLSCLACVTTCPSGVDYRRLVDHARVRIERTYRRPLADRLVFPGDASFPSGHSANAAAAWFALAWILASLVERRALKVVVWSVAGLVVAIVGVSRLYLGVHWPSDVLAGWAIGAAWVVLGAWAARRLRSRATP